MEVKNCPGCSSQEFQVRGRRGSSFDVQLDERIFKQPEYRIKCCDVCGLYYKSHTLSDSELFEYYRDVDFSKWEIEELFPSEQSLIDALSALPTGSRILDYGCSSGRLLSRLVAKYKCFGVELNSKAAAIAQQRGIEILSEQEISSSTEPMFDAVVLCDTFEHLPNPTDVLRLLRQSLSQNGVLLLCTGNADAKACQRDLANFWYFRTPEHLCMLGKRHVDYLSQTLNLKLILWQEVSHYDTGYRERLKQHAQNFAYWKFQTESKTFSTSALRLIPLLNRAENWNLPPALTCTKDHVIVVLKDQSPTTSQPSVTRLS